MIKQVVSPVMGRGERALYETCRLFSGSRSPQDRRREMSMTVMISQWEEART